jgi:XTP/dITP diphosphohydrolase
VIPELLVATTNRHKVGELRELLGDTGVVLVSPDAAQAPPVVVETGATYFANAELKAAAYARWSGLPALADDSGLEVDALGGKPGILSARYAGEVAGDAANIDKLLRNLRGVPQNRRSARFRCCIVVARPDGARLSAEGVCEGSILEQPHGAGGFGYDPVFYYPPAHCSFAELSSEQKNRVSHRAMACAVLAARLAAFVRAG